MLVAFEESAGDLAADVAFLGFDLERMPADGQRVVDSIQLDPTESLAVSTLVRWLSPRLRKIISDSSQTEQVLVGLQLRPQADGPG